MTHYTRPVGWRYESHRHAMAARGIKTKRWNDILTGGRGDRLRPSDVDQRELAMGIKEEREHTSSRHLATEISLDHLAEDPHYYTKLKVMEGKGRAYRLAKFHLPEKSLLDLIPADKRQEAIKAYVEEDLTSSQLARRYGLDWQSNRSGEKGEYSSYPPESVRIEAIKRAGRELGRMPTIFEMEQRGEPAGEWRELGGFATALRVAVDEEMLAAKREGRTTDPQKDWFWQRERKLRVERPISERLGFKPVEDEWNFEASVKGAEVQERQKRENEKGLKRLALQSKEMALRGDVEDFNDLIADARRREVPVQYLLQERDKKQAELSKVASEKRQYMVRRFS